MAQQSRSSNQVLRRFRVLATAVAASCIWTSGALLAGTTASWVAPVSGSWDNAARWSSSPNYPNNGNPPGQTYDAVIDAFGGAYKISAGGQIAVDSIGLNAPSATLEQVALGTMSLGGGPLNLTAGTYSVNSSTLRDAVVNLSEVGTLSVAGVFPNRAVMANVSINPAPGAGGQGPGVQFAGECGLDHVSLGVDTTVRDGAFLFITGGLTITGGHEVTLQGGNVTGFSMQGPAQTISGNGVLRLNSNVADLHTQAGAGPVTIGPGITISGGGKVRSNGGTIINQGTILADNPHYSIHVENIGSFLNSGTLESRPGGVMLLDAGGPNWVNTGIIRVAGGTMVLRGAFDQESLGPFEYLAGQVDVTATITNQGKTLRLDDTTGSWNLVSALVDGGTLAADDGMRFSVEQDSTLNTRLIHGVRLEAPLDLPNRSRVTVLDGLTLEGQITLRSSVSQETKLLFAGAQTLSGSGEIVFKAFSRNAIESSGGTLTIGSGVTIRTDGGGGTIGTGTSSIVNGGLIAARGAGAELKLVGGITNNGTLECRDSGSLRLRALPLGSGTLDVSSSMYVDYGGASPLPEIVSQVVGARAVGWLVPGVTSLAAGLDPLHATTIAVVEMSDYNREVLHLTVDIQTVWAKYTYFGDADLNGRVEFDDYVRIDAGFNGGLEGWLNGDFDLNGVVDFDDYVYIDLGFNAQSGTLRRAQAFLDGTDRTMAGMDAPGLQIVMRHFEEFGIDYAVNFLAAVPEPGAGLTASIGLIALSSRLWRRTKFRDRDVRVE